MVKGKSNDGWHKIKQYEVYVENGVVIRVIKHDRNGQRISAAIYTSTPRRYGGGLTRIYKPTFDQVKSGIYSGRYSIQ